MPRKSEPEVQYSSVEEYDAAMRVLVDESAALKGDINAIRDRRREINEELKPLRDARRKLVLKMAQPEEASDDN